MHCKSSNLCWSVSLLLSLGNLADNMLDGQVQQREGASEDDVKAAEEAIENASV